MNWTHYAIERLKIGLYAELTPRGNSMVPLIYSGEKVMIAPVGFDLANKQDGIIEIGDIVLAKVRGSVMLHLVKAISSRGYLICNNKGRENGWTKTIYGKFIKKVNHVV